MILDLIQTPKRLFNPKRKEDLIAYKNFLKKGWGDKCCPFVLVFPYTTIPHMIENKIIHNVLGVKNEKSRY